MADNFAARLPNQFGSRAALDLAPNLADRESHFSRPCLAAYTSTGSEPSSGKSLNGKGATSLLKVMYWKTL